MLSRLAVVISKMKDSSYMHAMQARSTRRKAARRHAFVDEDSGVSSMSSTSSRSSSHEVLVWKSEEDITCVHDADLPTTTVQSEKLRSKLK